MMIISAKTGNSGTAIGRLLLYTAFSVPAPEKASDTAGETARLGNAVGRVRDSYSERLKVCKSENNDHASAILETQLMMLDDDSFTRAVEKKVREGFTAEYAAYAGAEETALSFERSDSEYMRARSADIRSVGRKLIDTLRGVETDTVLTEDTVVFAEDISPEMLVSFDRRCLKGIVSDSGSALSHTAILAGTLGIPYLFHVKRSSCPKNGTIVIVNGDEGTMICSPDEAALAQYRERLGRSGESLPDPGTELPVRLYANIAGPQDLEAVLRNGADGIGLFRTEFLFMQRSDLPSEEEQFEAYRQVAETMGEKEVIIRTMDIGTDKKTECLHLPEEENPALGKRAIRICLDDTELFRTQLRALLRAACFGNIRIMYPMISSEWELTEIEKQLSLAAEELKARGCAFRIPECGIMIETPAAAVLSDILAQRVRFFSIGSNDLTQYTLAADRLSSGMDRYFDSEHEAVFRLIRMTVENARKHHIPVGLCGEIGGKPGAIQRLLDIGIDELSMSPARIPAARKAVYEYIQSREFQAEYGGEKAPDEPPAAPAQEFEELSAPCDGMIVEAGDIPDAAFSSGVLGNCIAVDPENGIIHAPCDGTISMVAASRHALSIRTASGRDILIHAGIDTVTLNGDGFECGLGVGDRVRRGDVILTEDMELIRSRGLSPMVIMVY